MGRIYFWNTSEQVIVEVNTTLHSIFQIKHYINRLSIFMPWMHLKNPMYRTVEIINYIISKHQIWFSTFDWTWDKSKMAVDDLLCVNGHEIYLIQWVHSRWALPSWTILTGWLSGTFFQHPSIMKLIHFCISMIQVQSLHNESKSVWMKRTIYLNQFYLVDK